jgi:predicted Zn-dependent protease
LKAPSRDILEVAADALRAADGDEAEALVLSERSGLARFASSEVHQPTLIENCVVTLRIVRDGKIGTASTNRFDDDGLTQLAARAGEAADSAVAEPAFPGLAPPEAPPEVEGYDDTVAAIDAEEQARHARAAIDASSSLGVFGFFTSAVTELAISSTTGVDAQQRMTDATTLVVAASDDASGYASQTSWSADGIDAGAVGREAVEKAERTRNAKTIEPAPYRAVLEPYAFADLIAYFAFDAFGANGLLEERSYLAGRIGERIVDEKVTIVDDALDARGLPKRFDFEGVAKQRVGLIENGIAKGVVWDRTTAARAGEGRTTTGHAPPPVYRQWGPLTFALGVEGGDVDNRDRLCELVDDGIYITRLHYLGIVDPREGVITGMTRDGTFRIRGGRVAEPLVNLRFTVSVPQMLQDVPGLSREVTLVNSSDFYGERYPVGTLVPALATARFNITGVGSAPGL